MCSKIGLMRIEMQAPPNTADTFGALLEKRLCPTHAARITPDRKEVAYEAVVQAKIFFVV